MEEQKNEVEVQENKKEEVKNKTEIIESEEDIKPSNKKIKIIALISVIVIIIGILFGTAFALVNINNKKIMKGVQINGVDVSGYSREELKAKYEEAIQKNQEKIIELKHNEQVTEITPELMGTTYNLNEVVDEAYEVGRNGNIISNNFQILKALIWKKDFKLEGVVDDKILEETINNLQANLEGRVEEASYYIEEDKLIIVRGKPGLRIEDEQLRKLINYKVNEFGKSAEEIIIPVSESEPKDIDLEKIYEEIHTEPQDAYITYDPLVVHPNVNGVDFAISMEEAKKIIEEYKEEYEIPLNIRIADKTLADLGKEAFPNKLGEFSTKFDVGNYSRSTNISIATNKINGLVILPGETFSYNKTVGKRTIDAGFKEAPAYSQGKVVQEVGGGICQVSSTLYNAVLYANLEIVERHNHTFESSYVTVSRDATVSWGGPDFKFKNSRQYPVRIEASSKNGTEYVAIYGIAEEDECEVIIQSRKLSTVARKVEYVDDPTLEIGEERVEQNGHDGCTGEAYRILRKNGEVISSTLLSKDTYNSLATIIRRGTKPASKTEEPVIEKPKQEDSPSEPDEPDEPVINDEPQNNDEPNENPDEDTSGNE